jgi:heptose-I-phosphate ethanolaminephosphotransferase
MQNLIKKYYGDLLTVGYSFFLVSPSLFYYFAEQKITSYMFLFVFLQILLVLLPVIVLKMTKALWNTLSIPFFLFALIQWGNFSIFKFELTEGAILAILDTNLNESLDFLNLVPLSFWMILPFILVGFVREMKSKKLVFTQIKHIKKVFITLIILLILPKIVRSPSTNTLKELFGKTYPARNIITLVKTRELRESYLISFKKYKNIKVQATLLHRNEVNILVIGESARRMNHSHFGYYRNTNKYTEAESANLYLLNNAFAASNSTIMSLKNTLTKTNEKGVYSLPSIVKAAGSNVTWISNQGKYGEHLSLLSMIANTGNDSIYINNSDFGGVSYDGKVVEHVQKSLTKGGASLIIVHLLGSHFNYIRRYPTEFDSFSGESIDGLTAKQSEIINRYDNSVLYTDFVISQIIKLLKDEGRSASLTYFSDHGEILYDKGYDFYGHGGGKEATKYELEIPLYVWMNDMYKNEHRLNVLRINKNKDFSLINFMPFYLDLIGVEVNSFPELKKQSENINYFNSKDELVPFNR